jgi:hypothetical protein
MTAILKSGSLFATQASVFFTLFNPGATPHSRQIGKNLIKQESRGIGPIRAFYFHYIAQLN